ncbi:MAG: amidohydrolase family protein [Cyanobacteriota/Melainabacteria group bacterium]
MGEALSLKADWLLPVTGPPIKNGELQIAGGRISALSSVEKIKSSSGTVVIPGLINLHSHLDYSEAPFLKNAPLFDWIERLVATTRQWSREDFERSAAKGAAEAILSGTTFLVDSSYTGQSALAMHRVGLKGIVGLELFGVDATSAAPVFSHWQKRMEELEQELQRLQKATGSESSWSTDDKPIELTISPHSLYTVSPELFRLAVNWAKDRKKFVLTHLAESPQERAWTDTGHNRLDSYLRTVLPGPAEEAAQRADLIKNIAWKGRGLSPVESLAAEGCIGDRLIAAHCVHLGADDLGILHQAGAAIAHCPRSNRNLENGRAPLEQFLYRELKTGLGTDSLASTESLSMLDEAKALVQVLTEAGIFARDEAQQLALRLITIDAARAAGADDRIGSLAPGKLADLVVLESTYEDPKLKEALMQDGDRVLDGLFNGAFRVRDVYVEGRALVKNGILENPVQKVAG